MTKILLFFLALPVMAQDTNFEEILNNFKQAGTLDAAAEFLAEDYRLHFNNIEGKGIDKSTWKKLLTWDFAVDPEVKFDSIKVSGRVLIANFHEANEFTRLIEFPGWSGKATYWFNAESLIEKQLLEYDDNGDYKVWLLPAVAWLSEHYPEVIADIYPNGQLTTDGENARKWIKWLKLWRESK